MEKSCPRDLRTALVKPDIFLSQIGTHQHFAVSIPDLRNALLNRIVSHNKVPPKVERRLLSNGGADRLSQVSTLQHLAVCFQIVQDTLLHGILSQSNVPPKSVCPDLKPGKRQDSGRSDAVRLRTGQKCSCHAALPGSYS